MPVAILDTLLAIGSKIIDNVIPDPAAQAAAKLELLKLNETGRLADMQQELQLAKLQTDTNTEEAKNTNIFISGWRPFIGWICGLGLGYQFLIYPILVSQIPKVVQLDMGTLLTLLAGMLGLAGLRTNEKLKGVAS